MFLLGFHLDELTISFCYYQTWDSSALGRDVSLGDENFVTCNYRKVADHSRKKSNLDDSLFIKSSNSDDFHSNEDVGLAVIVEDVTHSIPPDIPLASGVIPRVENEASDDSPSSRGHDAHIPSTETDHEVHFSCEYQLLCQYSSSLVFNPIVHFFRMQTVFLVLGMNQ